MAENHVYGHLHDEDPQLIREMFFFFYHGFYSAPIGIAGQHDIAISQKHIGMYSLAIKYDIKALQQYTTEEFQSHLAKCTTLDFLSTIESAYFTGEASPLRKIVVSEAEVRCRELMTPGSRARHIFFATMTILPAFERDMFVRYFEAGAGVMCKNCRGWIDQSTFCNRCTSVGLAKTEESDDEQDFGAHVHDELMEDSSHTLIADLTG
ncbi:MAG: hypothetical protein L6R37_002197 [Teloschistes peruensis]|nr:MAG: hypothetical protein L6R37_002197 [Teloschistes peruensis]